MPPARRAVVGGFANCLHAANASVFHSSCRAKIHAGPHITSFAEFHVLLVMVQGSKEGDTARISSPYTSEYGLL